MQPCAMHVVGLQWYGLFGVKTGGEEVTYNFPATSQTPSEKQSTMDDFLEGWQGLLV